MAQTISDILVAIVCIPDSDYLIRLIKDARWMIDPCPPSDNLYSVDFVEVILPTLNNCPCLMLEDNYGQFHFHEDPDRMNSWICIKEATKQVTNHQPGAHQQHQLTSCFQHSFSKSILADEIHFDIASFKNVNSIIYKFPLQMLTIYLHLFLLSVWWS